MGYRPGVSSEQDLRDIASRYVEGADAYFLAFLNGKPIGMNSATVWPDGSSELHTGVGVLPAGRGKNVGTRLVDYSLDWMMKRGAVQTEIRTQQLLGGGNANLRTYVRCGARMGRKFRMMSFGLHKTT
jgi:GNAT superfamily N-acetyltransferase